MRERFPRSTDYAGLLPYGNYTGTVLRP